MDFELAKLSPSFETISKLRVPPTEGELHILEILSSALGDDFEIYFNPYLDGDRPDIIIIRKGYGAIIIEVKDWNLKNFSINENNKWIYKESIVRSPQQQAFHYKKNLFDLHIRALGIGSITNYNFYKTIHVYVYFHKAQRVEIHGIYNITINSIFDSIKNLNKIRNDIPYSEYDKKINQLQIMRKRLERDLHMSWGRDNLETSISKIRKISNHVLFDDEVYEEFKRVLSPSSHTLTQGISINLDKDQLQLAHSRPEFSKIKGVAGSGKTSVLAQRAINAHMRHGDQVLILTFNITLKSLIKDMISNLRGSRAGSEYEISHYHSFILSQLSECGIEIETLMIKRNLRGRSGFYKLFDMEDIFEDQISPPFKYKTIIIDEIQDYLPSWIKIIRDNFLEKNGEMAILGDFSQNIYKRTKSQRESPVVMGFGSWKKLEKSYRSSEYHELAKLFTKFRNSFLTEYAEDEKLSDNQKELPFNNSVYDFQYISYGNDISKNFFFSFIQKYSKENKIHPNDIVIISSKIEILIPINDSFTNQEQTMITFETSKEAESLKKRRLDDEEFEKEIETIRRRKKAFFQINSGLVKISTIHSFKGLESNTVFCILNPDDNPEIVHTSITRAKANLIVFDHEESKYSNFFRDELNEMRPSSRKIQT